MRQNIRIIAGKYRGKKIHFPDLADLRPTPDRVRETLFNWLMHDVRGSNCLDAFAGSGALGLEAFSRGASKVILIEQNRNIYLSLKQQILPFEAGENLAVINTNCLDYLETTREQFNIIFLDPPFTKSLLSPCIELIQNRNLLLANGLLYIESPEKKTLDANYWDTLKTKRAGKVYYSLVQRRD